MNNWVQKLPRIFVLGAGFSFVAGVFVFGIAYFTVSIPDPNAYVNSQATIIQYADGSEIGRIADRVLTEDARIKSVAITVHKPSAPVSAPVTDITVRIDRTR